MAITVIQILPALDSGGVERGTLEVAQELVRRGHRSIVISAGGKMVKELEMHGSEHITLPFGTKSLFLLRYVPILRKIIRQTNTHILHVRSRFPAWLTYLAWRGLDVNHKPVFITSVHGVYAVNPYSKIMTRGEHIIAISEYIHEYIIENYPDTDPERISTVPRGVSPDRFPYDFKPDKHWLDTWHQQYPYLKDKIILTLPGRITRRKGQEDFMHIIAELRQVNPAIHGLIVGEAHPRRQRFLKELKALIDTLDLAGAVTFCGHRNDLREIMSISTFVLSLSKIPEAFGRTALESLSIGTGVVAYDHGGAHEVMNAIFPEGLVTPNNPLAAGKLIQQFLQNIPAVPDTNPFTLERMLDSTINLYEDLSNKIRKNNH